MIITAVKVLVLNLQAQKQQFVEIQRQLKNKGD